MSSLALVLHQCLKACAVLTIEYFLGANLKLRQLVLGQIDAATAGIVTNIPDDIGHLKSQSELSGKLGRLSLGLTKDLGRQNPHDAGHMPAIIFQLLPVLIA